MAAAVSGFATSSILEIGFVTVKSDGFVSVHTKTPFVAPRVIMGMPRNGVAQIAGGYQSCFRVKDITLDSISKFVSFDVRFTQPNDSWCNYTWWTPKTEPSQTVAWLVMNEGHFLVGGGEFDIKNIEIGGHCSYFFVRHRWFGLFSNKTRPASIATVQTYRDYRFTSFREVDSNNNAVGVSLYVQLHNYDRKFHPRVGDCVNGQYAIHYDNNRFRQAYTVTKEVVAVIGYTPQVGGICKEGVAFETHEIDGITSDPRWLPFCWEYSSEPGIFGMVNSFKGGDDITVRSFNYSNFGVGVIAQEDQCDKQSTIHIQGEKLSFFVIGETATRKLSHAGLVGPNTYAICNGLKTFVDCCNITASNAKGNTHAIAGQCDTPIPTTEPTASPMAGPTKVPITAPSKTPIAAPSPYPVNIITNPPTPAPTGKKVCVK